MVRSSEMSCDSTNRVRYQNPRLGINICFQGLEVASLWDCTSLLFCSILCGIDRSKRAKYCNPRVLYLHGGRNCLSSIRWCLQASHVQLHDLRHEPFPTAMPTSACTEMRTVIRNSSVLGHTRVLKRRARNQHRYV